MSRTKRTERDIDRKKKEAEQKNRDTVLLLISMGFILGGILGAIVEKRLSTEDYLVRFFQAAAQSTLQPTLWRELWVAFRWPAAVMVLSFLPVAGAAIPALFCVRSFFLSYGIAALVADAGLKGICYAGLLFGPVCLLAVPVFFVLGSEGLLRKALVERGSKKLLLKGVCCLPVLLLCVFLDWTVTPVLLTSFLQIFSA